MRAKELQCIVMFQTTTAAIAFEDAAKEAGLPGRIIPLPEAIAAGCGLVWKTEPKCRAMLERLICKRHLSYDSIHELVI